MTANKSPHTIAIIRALDPGKELNSSTPKAIHPLLGQPLIRYVLEAAQDALGTMPILLIDPLLAEYKHELDPYVEKVLLESELEYFASKLQTHEDIDCVMVINAEMPLLTSQTLSELIAAHRAAIGDGEEAPQVTILTYSTREKSEFNRLMRGVNGRIIAISRQAMALTGNDDRQEYNTGVYCITADRLQQALKGDASSLSNLHFPDDLLDDLVQDGIPVGSLSIDDPDEAILINTRIDLAKAEAILRQRVNQDLMLNGVTIIDPNTTYIEPQIKIGKDSVIWPNTYLQGSTQIGENCTIGPNTILRDTRVGNHCIVLFSVSDSAVIEDEVDIGPFARLREGAHLAEGVHMGNFGEVKNSYLGSGTKMGHFSYVGDTDTGPRVNIGAGVVVANYDGKRKHKTEIGARAFIGSDTVLVAPIKVGEDAHTGAGAIVTKDVPAKTLAVGMPARAIRKKEKDDGP